MEGVADQAAGAGSGEARGGLSFASSRLLALRATRARAEQVQDCLEGAPDYFARTEGRAPGPDAAVQLLADAEADPDRVLWVLVSRTRGGAVGILDVHLDYPEPRTAHVGLLLLRESCQGLGYGRETTAALEAALRSGGYRAIRLSVGDENPEARAFWEHLGFAGVGRLDRGVTVYEKPLGA